jgi:hypothetical protein
LTLEQFQNNARAVATILVETIGPNNWGKPVDDKMIPRLRRKLQQLCPDYEDRVLAANAVCGFMDEMAEIRERRKKR